MANIDLTFDVFGGGGMGPGTSGGEIKKHLEEIMSQINANPLKVKVDIDPASLKNIQNQISGTLGKTTGGKAAAISIDPKSIAGLSTLTDSLKDASADIKNISNLLDGFSQSYRAAFDGKETQSFVGLLDTITTSLQSVSDELVEVKNISESIFEIFSSGKSINITQKFNIGKGEDIQKLHLMQEETLALNSAVQALNDSFINSNKQGGGMFKGVSQADMRAYWELTPNLGAEDFIERAGKITGAEKTSAVTKYNTTLKEQYSLLMRIASASGIELPTEAIGAYEAAAKSRKEYSERVSQTANDIIKNLNAEGAAIEQNNTTQNNAIEATRTVAEASTSLFGDTSTDGLTSNINDRFSEISSALDALRQKILETFNFSTVPIDTSHIVEEIDKMKSDVSEIAEDFKEVAQGASELNAQAEKTNANTANKSGSKGNAGGDTNEVILEVGTNEYYDALKAMQPYYTQLADGARKWTDAARLSPEVYNSVTNLRAEYDQLYADLQSGTLSQGEFNDRLTKLSGAAADAAGEIRRLGQDTTALEEGTLGYEKMQRRIENQLKKNTSNLQKWSAAEHSSNQEARGAYESLGKQNIALQELAQKLPTMTMKEAATALENITRKSDEASTTIIKTGNNVKSFSDQFKSMAQRLSSWFSMGTLIMEGVQAIRKMVSASMELNDAFAQLQIVTGATDAQMEKFADTSADLAKKLGQNVSDVAGSIETFSRLGYNLSEASQLTEWATILSNVGAVSVDEATTGMTSIIKGFNMQTDDAEHVSDVLVEVGQKYAVSASELMEAFERSGAALNATNTSFEKSAGLIAAANAAVQDASTVGKLVPSITVM